VLQVATQDPAWCHAITLTERLELLRSEHSRSDDFQFNNDLADQRLRRWRSQTPFAAESSFTKRLAADEMTNEEFLRLLGESVEAIQNRLADPPKWLTEISQAYSRSVVSDGSLTIPTSLGGQGVLGFLGLIEPLIRRAHEGLHEGVQALVETYRTLPFDPEKVEAIFLSNLPKALLMLLSRTMALEVNVARLQGLLEGETPEGRFESFIARLQQPEIALAIMREYPVLARQLVIRINNWLDVTLEFLQRLCADWDDIRATLSPGRDPGLLVEADGSVSDSHRGGHSVFIATFSSGFQVVYKPKSLAIDVHLQELLRWLNDRGEHASFRTFKVIDRSAYGWTEFVAAQDCKSADELKRFYERQGGYLALLYALEATDFHCENLIAAGEHPTLIDLESLFHARTEDLDAIDAGQLAHRSMGHSVLRVGLMPQHIKFNDREQGVDLSGIGGAAGQLTPQGIPQWEDLGTDQVHLIRKRIAMPGGKNRPSLNGAEVNPLNYCEDIKKGFTNIYCLLMRHREELLADDGPLSRFATDEVRYIVRPTRTYALLLHESFHPDVLRNALDRDRLFDHLWVGGEQHPYLSKIISAELEALQIGDIPIFTTRPDSRDIWTSSNQRIPNFLDMSGLALVQRRIQQLNTADLERQLWFINASLVTLSIDTDGARWGTYDVVEPEAQATREQLVAAACAVGDRLESLALINDSEVSWIGVALVNEKHWSLLPMGGDLYNGLPGVAMFLAYLGATTGEERYTKLAQATVTTIRDSVEHQRTITRSVGGFDGLGGWIYVLTHLGTLWNQPELLAEAESFVELLPPLIERDEQLDIISGAAGCLVALIGLQSSIPSERTLATAIQCGDHLLERAQKMEQGIGWRTPMTGTKPLAGFSHGTAGIAYALLSLAAVSGEERFRDAALEAIAYERSIFSPAFGNWPDLRTAEGIVPAENDDAQQHSMFAWCHGAPGVALARLCSLPHIDDQSLREEIDVALKATLANGFGRNHSLCHGDLGNLEPILRASKTLDEPQWSSEVKRMASIVLQSIDKHGWLCGIPLGVESPGLMTGLAGIGYGLLRLAEPQRTPSVLVLDPPACSTGFPEAIPRHLGSTEVLP